MTKIIPIVVIALAAVVATTSFAQTAETGQVKINTQTRFARSNVTVRFIELIDDSRCAVDVTCVWAGNAQIRIRVSRNGRSKTVVLNTGIDPKHTTFAGYNIRFTNLTPVPRSNVRINRNEYVATISIKRL